MPRPRLDLYLDLLSPALTLAACTVFAMAFHQDWRALMGTGFMALSAVVVAVRAVADWMILERIVREAVEPLVDVPPALGSLKEIDRSATPWWRSRAN